MKAFSFVVRGAFASAFAAMWVASMSMPASAEGLLTFKSENDNYSAGDDGHYTNGVEVSWAFIPPDQHWLRDLADTAPGWSANGLDGVAYRFTHQMYTPDNIEVARLIENDRPYAGVLMGGISLFDSERHTGWRKARSLTLDAGIVGPASGADFLQREFHRWIGSDKPEGWDYQLDNEPLLNLAYRSAWIAQRELNGYEVELGPSAGFALGNLYTYAATGLGVRFGENLERSFGIPSIAPSQGGRSTFLPGQGVGWYAFAAVEGRYMAHNLLLDGNTFEDSHSVNRREWVGDALVGAAFTWNQWQLTYTYAWRTDEFKEQARHDQFGSLSLSLWF
ncbi:lipid A deacylase LpxR family protein [Halomonas korlensis]|uniref:Outer membrane protein n=1 Tax=Halomonas korlensis TaxID=463301 RepID=A0A1I7FYI6_9GAMM|nr:hypothetical protein SAMN04487955_102101 [Halomonas korlensis]